MGRIDTRSPVQKFRDLLKRWQVKTDGQTHLREMFDVTEAQLLSFVPDYRINLLAPHGIPEADFRKFRTDVGPLLQYIKNQKNKNRLDEIMHEDDRFRHMDVETANLINTVTGSRLKFDAKEDKINMCQAIDDMRKESMEKGIESTLLDNLKKIMAGLNYTAQQAMDLLQVPAADRPKYMAKL